MDQLQLGLHIQLPLKWNDHPFLFNRFKIKSQEQIDIIRHLGLKYVFYNAEQSDTEPLRSEKRQINTTSSNEAVNKATEQAWQEKQARIEKLNAYRRRVIQCEKDFDRSLSRMRSVMGKIRSRPLSAMADAKSLVDDVVDALMADDNVTLHLMNGKNEFEDIYFHSLNVAVISMMIGKAKGLDTERLKQLAFAALFHDVGKIKIPTAILRKQTALSESERNYLKLHTKYGSELCKSLEGFPQSAIKVIEQHHEYLDGSGYPLGLQHHQIDEFAQIVCVADTFDHLCHHQNPTEKKAPHRALSYLFKHERHLYNNEYLSLLVRFMGIYPPGTVVQLSNQTIGLVLSVNSEALLYPNVLVYDPSVPRTQAPIIDLSKNDLKIVNAIEASKLPEVIHDYLNPRARISYFFDTDN